MNNVNLVGRISKDIELRYLPNSKGVANFNVAVNRNFTNSKGEKEADFINIVIFGSQAENVKKYCIKGSLIGLNGRIQTRNYEDKDGKRVYVTEVVADNVQFLENKKTEQNGQAPQENKDKVYSDFGNEIELTDDDIDLAF